MLLSQFNRDLVHRRCIVKIGDEARVEKILGQSGLRKLRENLYVSLVNNSANASSTEEEIPERQQVPTPPVADAFPAPTPLGGKVVPELPADNAGDELIEAELLPPQGSVSPSGKTVVLNHWSENIVLDKWGNPVPINQAARGSGRGRGGGGRGVGRGGGVSGGVRGGGVRGGRTRGRPPLGGRPGRGRPPKRQHPSPVAAAFYKAAGGLVRPRLRLRVTVSEGRYAVRDVSPDGADGGGGGGGGDGDLERAQSRWRQQQQRRERERPINQPHVRAQVLAPLDATAAVGALLLTQPDEAEYVDDDTEEEYEQKSDCASEPPLQEKEIEEQPLTKVNSPRPPTSNPRQTQVQVSSAVQEEDFFPKPQRTSVAAKGIDLAGLVAETIGDPESAVLGAPPPPAAPLIASRLVCDDTLLPELARYETVKEQATSAGAEKSSGAPATDSVVGEGISEEKCSSIKDSIIESGGNDKSSAELRGGNSSETPVEKKEENSGQTANAQEGGSSSRESIVKGEERCYKSENAEGKKSDAKEVKSEAKAPKEEVVEDEEELPEEELDPLWITPPTSDSPSSPESIKIISSEEEVEDDKKRVDDGGEKKSFAVKNSEPEPKRVKEGDKNTADKQAPKEVAKAFSGEPTEPAKRAEEPAEDQSTAKSEVKNGETSSTVKQNGGNTKSGKTIIGLHPSGSDEDVIAKPVCPQEARPCGGGDAKLKPTSEEAVKRDGEGANEGPEEDADAKKPLTGQVDHIETASAVAADSKPESGGDAATTFEGVKKAVAAEAWQSLADRIAVKAALKRVIHEVEMRVGSAASVSVAGRNYDSATAAAVAAAAGGGVPAVASAVPPARPSPPPALQPPPPVTTTPPTSPPPPPPSRQLHQLPPTSPSPKSYSAKPGPASKKHLPRKRKRKC